MARNKILTEKDTELVKVLHDMYDGYSLYNNVIETQVHGKTKQYIVVGIDPINENFDVQDALRKQERNPNLFYTKHYVVEYDPNADFKNIVNEPLAYCGHAEMIQTLFKKYDMPIPEILSSFEVKGLRAAQLGRIENKENVSLVQKYKETIDDYFRDLKTKNPIKKAWIEFKRSDLYHPKKSWFQNISNFLFQRHDQQLKLDELIECSDDTKTIVIHEHELEKFQDIMARDYPDVLYSVSNVLVNNDGMTSEDLKRKPTDPIPYGSNITAEEFDRIAKETLHDKQWKVLNHYQIAYSETRKITFRNVDEPLVAIAYHKVNKEYARPNDLSEILYQDKALVWDVPCDDFMNFVSLMKYYKVPFVIDYNGEHSKPSFDTLAVIIRHRDKDKFEKIKSEVISSKFDQLRYTTKEEKLDAQKSLTSQISNAQTTRPTYQPSFRTQPERE